MTYAVYIPVLENTYKYDIEMAELQKMCRNNNSVAIYM